MYCYEGEVQRIDCWDDEDDDGNPIQDTNWICATSTSEAENFVSCVYSDEEYKCETVNDILTECGYDPYEWLYEYQYTYTCIQFDNNEKYWYYLDEEDKYCSNRCSDGCEVLTCDEETAAQCTSNNLALNCMENDEGDLQIFAEDCESYKVEMVCEIDDDEFAACQSGE